MKPSLPLIPAACCALLCIVLAACEPARQTFTVNIIDGTIAVENAAYKCDTVVIGDTLYRPRVTGPFTVSGSGTHPDIRISVVNGINYRNWLDIGADYSSYYYSGEVTGGTISASLPSLRGDTYYVIYDNRFDPFRDKDVYRRIDLEYQQ
jgi:hypothetical protein